MPVTGHEISRRAMLALVASPALGRPQSQPAGTARRDTIDLFSVLASALSEGNGLAFLGRIDHSMKNYQELEQNVLALTAQNELQCAIDVLKDEGDDRTRAVEADWFLQIRANEPSGPLERRRVIVKCRIERRKKNWIVVSFEPVQLFAPPAAR